MTDSLQVDATVQSESSSHDVVTFHVFNNTTDPIVVRLVQPLPDSVDPADVGTAQSKHKESWHATHDELVFEHEIDWGMSLRTNYAIRNVTPDLLVGMFEETDVTAHDEDRTVLEQFRGVSLELPSEYTTAETEGDEAEPESSVSDSWDSTEVTEQSEPAEESPTVSSPESVREQAETETDDGTPVGDSDVPESVFEGSNGGRSDGTPAAGQTDESVTSPSASESSDKRESTVAEEGSGPSEGVEPTDGEEVSEPNQGVEHTDEEEVSGSSEEMEPTVAEEVSEPSVEMEPTVAEEGSGPSEGVEPTDAEEVSEPREGGDPTVDETVSSEKDVVDDDEESSNHEASVPPQASPEDTSGGHARGATSDAGGDSRTEPEAVRTSDAESSDTTSYPPSNRESSSPASPTPESPSDVEESSEDESADTPVGQEFEPGSEGTDQVTIIPEDCRTISKTFAVAGAKGGVGKTTTSINLGSVMARAGLDVVVVELDLAMANLVDFLDIDVDVDSDVTFHDVLAGTSSIDLAIYDVQDGPDVVPSGTSLDGYSSTDLGRLPSVLEELKARYDVVIIDTPAGLSRETIRPLELADEILLVSTPRMSAVRNAENTIDVANRVGTDVTGIVLTKSGTGASPGGVKIAEFLEVELLGHVPDDDAIPLSQDAGHPVVEFDPSSPAATAYGEVTREILANESGLPADAFEPDSSESTDLDAEEPRVESDATAPVPNEESLPEESPARPVVEDAPGSPADDSLNVKEDPVSPRSNGSEDDDPDTVNREVESDVAVEGTEPTEVTDDTPNEPPANAVGSTTEDSVDSRIDSSASAQSQDRDETERSVKRTSKDTRSDGSGREPNDRSLGRKLKSLFGL